MNFKSRKINRKPRRIAVPKAKKEKSKSSLKLPTFNVKLPKIHIGKFSISDKKWLTISIIAILLLPTTVFGYKFLNEKFALTNTFTKTVLKTVGTEVPKDSLGYTNILALGVGGEQHDGGDLTDTIMVVSINEKKKNVIMTSLPRDLYVSHENIISQRINSVYENTRYKLSEDQAFKTLEDIVSELTNIPIHYYVKVDFQGLKDVVDAVGGITIYNEETVYDPYYPGPNYTYETFSLGKGYQHLDGETALKYVRSRKTSSDFARAQRQQQLIAGVKDKALQLDLLSSKDKINKLYKSVEKNLQTDLQFGEMLTLAGIGATIDTKNLTHLILNDDFNNTGGFLYTPPRSLYKDAYVLLPADKSLSQIHKFIELHRVFSEFMQNPDTIDIVNATGQSGLGGQTAIILTRFGFKVNDVRNSENKTIEEVSKIESSFNKTHPGIKALQSLLPLFKDIQKTEPIMPDPESDGLPSQISLILGNNFLTTFNNLEVFSSLAPLIQQAIEENRAVYNSNENEDGNNETNVTDNDTIVSPDTEVQTTESTQTTLSTSSI